MAFSFWAGAAISSPFNQSGTSSLGVVSARELLSVRSANQSGIVPTAGVGSPSRVIELSVASSIAEEGRAVCVSGADEGRFTSGCRLLIGSVIGVVAICARGCDSSGVCAAGV